jgi:hypothetical protein
MIEEIRYIVKRRTPLDEIELALGLLENTRKELIEGKTNKEISDILNRRFKINSTEEDVNLLYEPTISEMEVDLRLHFEAMNLSY